MSDDDSFAWQSRQHVRDPICDGDTDDELDMNGEQSDNCMSTASASSVVEKETEEVDSSITDVDAKAQFSILLHPLFVPFITNHTQTVQIFGLSL